LSNLVLYCKSYRTDLRRVQRLVESVERFNSDKIPFFLSVPEADFKLFKNSIDTSWVQLITDEEILKAVPRINLDQVRGMHGAISQQIIKSEFWRLKLAETYVCLDSDAIYIRPFFENDFLAANGFPYTVIDEAHDLLEDAIARKSRRVVDDFFRESTTVRLHFGRRGRDYSFGPFPVVWHAKVWESLDKNYLIPRSMSLADAIRQAPIESRWYGEALLAYNAIPLYPCQSIFKVYHYAWQYDRDRKIGVGVEKLAELYCGVIYQSAWEREMDWPSEGGGKLSKLGRALRRRLGRI